MSRNRMDWTRFAAAIQANGEPWDHRPGAVNLIAGQPTGLPPHVKYGNRAVFIDGYRFASQLEADRYQELKLLKASGEVRWFTRQVPFALSPSVTYRADFVVVWDTPARWNDLGVTVEETKGVLTEAARIKLALVSERYGVSVRILKRADVRRFA